MLTNLKDILSVATVVNPNELVTKTVEWEQKNPATGEVEPYRAEVQVLTNISFAASERITIGSRKTGEAERLARNIVERIRFDGEKMSYEQAASVNPNFGWALVSVVYEVDNPKVEDEATEEPDEAKE